MFVGEAGMGKTALLTHLADVAAVRTDTRVIWLRGEESEAVLPFAAAADLLLPLREHFDRLPECLQRRHPACARHRCRGPRVGLRPARSAIARSAAGAAGELTSPRRVAADAPRRRTGSRPPPGKRLPIWSRIPPHRRRPAPRGPTGSCPPPALLPAATRDTGPQREYGR